MTYLVYQGVYQTPDCSQMIGWYTIRQTQKQRDAAKLQEVLTALEGKKVADMFKPWKVHNRNYTEEPEVAIDTATFVASQPLYSRRISRIKKNFFPQGHMSEIYSVLLPRSITRILESPARENERMISYYNVLRSSDQD